MSRLHPAFSNQKAPIAELLSEPFVSSDTFVALNEFSSIPTEHIIPYVVGVRVLHEGGDQFMTAVSQQSTTPLNHVSQYLDRYSERVGRAHNPIFEGRTESPLDTELVSVFQGNLHRVLQEDKVNILCGFMLGLSSDSKTPSAWFLVQKRALDLLHKGIEAGFNRVVENGVFSTASPSSIHIPETLDMPEPTRDELLDTTKDLLLTASIGRLLLNPRKVKNAFTQSSPELRELYAKTKKAQQKFLKAERRAANAYN